MAEYSYDNIIVNPFKEGIESLIGKEVYFHINPYLCLKNANEKSIVNLGTLVEIRKDSVYPFIVKRNSADVLFEFSVIIEKKEEPKPEYRPFKSMEEFVKKYEEVRGAAASGSFEDSLFRCGMWLKTYNVNTEKPVYMHVSRIECEGIQISDRFFITWEDLLLRGSLFLDGTPCGQLKENSNG